MSPQLKMLALVAGMLSVGLLALLQTGSPLAWTIIPIATTAGWMMGEPKRLIAGYWLWSSVSEYLWHVTGYGMIRFGDEFLLVLIAVAAFFDRAVRRRDLSDLRIIGRIVLILLVLFALSYYVNRGSPFRAAITLGQYYRPFLLGYVAYVAIRPGDLRSVIYLYIASALFEFLVNLTWLLGISPLPHPMIFTGIDWAVGTMGLSTYVAYTAMAGIVLCLALFRVFRRPVYLLLLVPLAFSFAFTNTVHAYPFLGVMVVLLALLPLKNPLHTVAMGFGTTIVLLALAIGLSTMLPRVLPLEQYWVQGRILLKGRKMESYIRHVTELPRDVPFFPLGAGPGNLSTAFAEEDSYLTAKYHGWGYSFDEVQERAAGSIVSQTRTGLLAIWADMGPIAFLLYWGVHIYALSRVVRQFRNRAYEDPYQRALAISFVPVMALFLMVALLFDIIHIPLWGGLPWMWAGLVWTPYRVESVPIPEVAAEPSAVPSPA